MTASDIDKNYAAKLIQYGWKTISEALKYGGLTNMMNRLSNPAKIECTRLSNELKLLMKPLFEKHMNDIMSGSFSKNMILDWSNNDEKLLEWRRQTGNTHFEKTPCTEKEIAEQEFFDNGTLMVAFLKAGVELAYEIMVDSELKKSPVL